MMKKIFPDKPLSEYGRGELAVAILSVAAIVAIAIPSFAVALGLAQLAQPFAAKNKRDRRRVRGALLQLQRDGLISSEWRKSGKVVPTTKGVRYAEYERLTIRKTPWDGRWRLFMFDIPEEKKIARIALSRKVMDMGMRPYQKSVYISPYPCEKELAAVAAFLDVETYIRLVVASKISEVSSFRKSFSL